MGTVHRAYRYGKDYPAFTGKDLSKRRPFKLGVPIAMGQIAACLFGQCCIIVPRAFCTLPKVV